MDREHLIATLRQHEPALKAAGIVHLRLHGSVARAESQTSDVDLIAEFDPAKHLSLKAFGPDHVINTSPRNGEAGVPKFRDDVKAFTGGHGVEVVFDTVGSDVSQESMRSLAFGGRMVIVGWAGNTTVAQGGGKRGSDNADRLPTNIMQMKGLYVMGSPMVIHSGREPGIRAPRLESIFKWVGEGRITPYVSHTYPLAEYRQAMHAKLIGKVNGNCVLHPN
jgi:NADPH:quinone reductase